MAKEYINRLIRCGYSPCNACLVYHDFLKDYPFSVKELNNFIESLEKEKGVKQCGSSIILTP